MHPYPIPPIVGAQVYKNDVLIVRDKGQSPIARPARGDVQEFTFDSRQRLAFVACNTDIVFRTMITLTYPAEYPTDGIQVKKHLHTFFMWLRRDLGSKPSYLWFLEFQKRGAPHFHILLDWTLPGSRADTKAFRFRVASSWYRIVGSQDPKHLAAGTRAERIRKPDGAARYAVKYALKMRQKKAPSDYHHVGRFWGASRDVKPTPKKTVRCTEDDVRGALEGWPYAPDEKHPVYRMLYGVADRFDR